MTTDEGQQALAEYRAVSAENAQLRARCEKLCGPIRPLGTGPVPSYSSQQIAALMAVYESDDRLHDAFRKLAKARGLDL